VYQLKGALAATVSSARYRSLNYPNLNAEDAEDVEAPRPGYASGFVCRPSFHLQVKAPRFIPLDAPEGLVCMLLLCEAVLNHMNGELAVLAG
jgi:hypothetical protein